VLARSVVVEKFNVDRLVLVSLVICLLNFFHFVIFIHSDLTL